MSLGATHFMPKKNRLSYWKKELIDQLAVLMGGRAAEEIFVGDMSCGAQMDITQATRLARSMVCEWGMSPLGTVAYDERTGEGQYLGMNSMAERSYSEETAKQIDAEVRKMMDLAHEQAIEIINKNRDKVELMTKMLIKFETLDKEDVKEMMDGTWTDVKKEARLKATENLQRKSPASAPVKTGPASDTPEPQQA